VEQEEKAISRRRRGKHFPAAMNQHAKIEKLLEAVFSVWSSPSLYSDDQREKLIGGKPLVVK
jgi:hypothetical protein